MTKYPRIRTYADALLYLEAHRRSFGGPERTTEELDGVLYVVLPDPCGRCGGTGRYGPPHVLDGVCLECAGEPTAHRVRHVEAKKYARSLKASATRFARVEAARVAAAEAASAAVEAFLAARPGLREALTADHDITRDLACRLQETGSLTDKQVALAFKLAAPKAEEVHVPAPVGRVTFTGLVVSVKEHESDWGVTNKMVVKVATEAGVWLAWGTAKDAMVGDTVEITATLSPGRDAHFAFFKRPKIRVLRVAQAA